MWRTFTFPCCLRTLRGLGESSLHHSVDCRLSSGSQLKTYVSPPVTMRSRKSTSLRDLRKTSMATAFLLLCVHPTKGTESTSQKLSSSLIKQPIKMWCIVSSRYQQYPPILRMFAVYLGEVIPQFLRRFRVLKQTLDIQLFLHLIHLRVYLLSVLPIL